MRTLTEPHANRCFPRAPVVRREGHIRCRVHADRGIKATQWARVAGRSARRWVCTTHGSGGLDQRAARAALGAAQRCRLESFSPTLSLGNESVDRLDSFARNRHVRVARGPSAQDSVGLDVFGTQVRARPSTAQGRSVHAPSPPRRLARPTHPNRSKLLGSVPEAPPVTSHLRSLGLRGWGRGHKRTRAVVRKGVTQRKFVICISHPTKDERSNSGMQTSESPGSDLLRINSQFNGGII